MLIGDGLSPVDDSGVSPPNPELLVDRVTNDTTPTFWGRAEANAIIRLYVDSTATASTTRTSTASSDRRPPFRWMGRHRPGHAIPIDGTNQEPHGYWEIESIVSFNDPTIFPSGRPADRSSSWPRTWPATSTCPDDLLQERLRIFIDTQGPRITSVFITDVPGYDLFNPKGPDANAQGPTPLVKQLTITFTDPPFRFDLMIPPCRWTSCSRRSKAETVITDHFQVIGDQNGRIAIVHPLGLTQTLVPVPGMPGFFFATATVTLTFFTPLPDDRFTLIVTDDVRDPANNRLDGETNAAEPQENPRFPSGDGVPGGDFVARFTVDSRPELAVYAGIRVYADINGNFVFDPEGQDNDAVNRDIVFRFGSTSDALFAGKFVTPPNVAVQTPAPVVPNRFFDQFAAYGNILGAFRWLFDFDSNGVADLVTTQPAGFQINGIPVAGNFDGNFANGDEIGLFDGITLVARHQPRLRHQRPGRRSDQRTERGLPAGGRCRWRRAGRLHHLPGRHVLRRLRQQRPGRRSGDLHPAHAGWRRPGLPRRVGASDRGRHEPGRHRRLRRLGAGQPGSDAHRDLRVVLPGLRVSARSGRSADHARARPGGSGDHARHRSGRSRSSRW